MTKSQVFTDIHSLDQAGVMTYADFTIESGGNLMIFGPAGCGKTEMCIQSAVKLGYDYTYLNLSVLEAPDLVGLPMIDEARGVSKYALPEAFPRPPAERDSKHKGKVLIVDEIDKAKPELQNPMLELIQFRSINGTELDFDSVLITGNRPDEGAFSLPVSKALTNRCKVYQLTPLFDPWRDWATNAGVNSLIIGFLSRNNEFFHRPNKSGDQTAYASPSPRSWSYAGRELDFAMGVKHITDYTFLNSLISGYVGITAATKFQVWLEFYKEVYPMVDDLVKHGRHPHLDSNTIDRILVCAIASCQEITKLMDKGANDNNRKEVMRVVDNVYGWMTKLPADIQIAAAKSTLQMSRISEFKLVESKPFMDVFKHIGQAMKGS